MDLPVLGDGLLGEVLEEGEDLLVKPVATRGPLQGPAENAGAFAEFGEVEFLGAACMEVVDFLLQFLEEDEFKPVPSFPGGPCDREGDGRSNRFEIAGYGIAANAPQHAFHSFEEILQGEDTPRAFVLKVVQDTVADVVDEGKICTVAGLGRALEGEVDPFGPVACHLVAADLEDREFADKTDHDVIIP